MSIRALDTPYSILGNVHNFQNAGYNGIIRYISPNSSTFPNKCLTGEEIAAIHSVPGMKIGLVWEAGFPTSPAYFDKSQGEHDADLALAFLKAHAVPTAVPVFFAVDYDASSSDIPGPIKEYFTAVHSALKSAGYLIGVYGSGEVTNAIVGTGIAHYAWLAQSTGWSGYAAGKALADIIQGPSKNICGIDCDTNEVVNEACLW